MQSEFRIKCSGQKPTVGSYRLHALVRLVRRSPARGGRVSPPMSSCSASGGPHSPGESPLRGALRLFIQHSRRDIEHCSITRRYLAFSEVQVSKFQLSILLLPFPNILLYSHSQCHYSFPELFLTDQKPQLNSKHGDNHRRDNA